MSGYCGRRPEPPYGNEDRESLNEAVEMLRGVATEYRRMSLAFPPGDSRSQRCDELSDEVISFVERVAG